MRRRSPDRYLHRVLGDVLLQAFSSLAQWDDMSGIRCRIGGEAERRSSDSGCPAGDFKGMSKVRSQDRKDRRLRSYDMQKVQIRILLGLFRGAEDNTGGR